MPGEFFNLPADLICFSHLRWAFVYQRPNHLMARAAVDRRVWFIEEPLFDAAAEPFMECQVRDGVTVVTPHFLSTQADTATDRDLRPLLDDLLAANQIRRPVRWYLTPMALPWSEHVPASAVIYDCMDELSAFRGAPQRLVELEAQLLRSADLLFTGGRQLYLTKRSLHPDVHLFPSSVDRKHFARARLSQPDPADQAGIGRPRLGWFGVIDERLDLDLLAGLAALRPEWQLVLVGPVAKIDPAEVPVAPNIHVLGPKPYPKLPSYLAGWDVGIMPFALNEATRFISPTKTPEYLAGGRPVASTPISDVVEPYGQRGLAQIGEGLEGFTSAVERALTQDRAAHVRRADAYLAHLSWDRTWSDMARLISSITDSGRRATTVSVERERAAVTERAPAALVPARASAP